MSAILNTPNDTVATAGYLSSEGRCLNHRPSLPVKEEGIDSRNTTKPKHLELLSVSNRSMGARRNSSGIEVSIHPRWVLGWTSIQLTLPSILRTDWANSSMGSRNFEGFAWPSSHRANSTAYYGIASTPFRNIGLSYRTALTRSSKSADLERKGAH
jgi:hypothetical protein